MTDQSTYILTLSCTDTAGIVAAVSGFLTVHHGFILESAQMGDASTKRFFQRTVFSLDHEANSESTIADLETLKRMFQDDVATPFEMEWEIIDRTVKPRVAILVSKQDHCLNDLLNRYASGTLHAHIPLVISNHEATQKMVDWYGIDFHHLPVTASTKADQEQQILDLLEKESIDLVVLARYMQILSPALVSHIQGKAINIHHSFLPGFKGAKPYHQAFERGVKIIGATAHYVSDELDEGPIIEQEVTRVNHSHTPEKLLEMGRDIECQVLSRAVKFHLERRVLLNGNKTVVF